MPSQTWLEADEALREAEGVFQPIKQSYEDRETSYAEMFAARRQRDAALEVWRQADDRENVMTLPTSLPPGLTIDDVWAL